MTNAPGFKNRETLRLQAHAWSLLLNAGDTGNPRDVFTRLDAYAESEQRHWKIDKDWLKYAESLLVQVPIEKG